MNTRDIFLQVLDKQLSLITAATGKTPHVLLYKGKRVRVPSGKMVWNSKAAASSALGNAIKYSIERAIRKNDKQIAYRAAEEEYQRIRKELLDEGVIEIKEA